MSTILSDRDKLSLKKAEEQLELHRLLSEIREIDLTKHRTEQERVIKSLDSFDIVKERKKAPAKKAKKHWQTVQKHKREARRRHYVNEKNKRKYEWKGLFEEAQKSGDEAGVWYKWLSRESTRSANKQRPGWKITEEEFREFIWPALAGRIPVIQRYDKDGYWSLHNTWWSVEGKAVFDGKEHLLRELGYTIG